MDPAKLKVVELRAALAERGLDTKGNKPVLVDRLRKALEEYQEYEEKSSEYTEDTGDIALKEASERVAETTRSSQSPRTPSRSSRSSSIVTPTKISTRNASRTVTTPNSSKQLSPSKPQYIEKADEALMTISESTSKESAVQEEVISKLSPEKYIAEQKDNISNIVQNETYIPSEKFWEGGAKNINIFEDNKYETYISQVPATKSEQSSTVEHLDQLSRTREKYDMKEANVHEGYKVSQPIREVSIDEIKDIKKLEEKTEIKEDIDKVQDDTFETDIKDKISFEKGNIGHIEDIHNIKDNVDIPEIKQPIHVISDQTCDIEMKNKEKTFNDNYALKEEKLDVSSNMEDVNEKADNIDSSQNKQTTKIAEMQEDIKLNAEESNEKDCKDRKRKRSPSPPEVRQLSPALSKSEDEPDFDDSAVILSWYDSDLNLVINKNGFLSATPMHNDDFCHIWAGARASYGFLHGKVYYEAKITEYCPISAMHDKEQLHVFRIGWSVPTSSMQLGEEKFSYAYTNTGKKGTNKKFMDYGLQFAKDDIVGCYLDMTSEIVELIFTINGKNLGSAFSIPKEKLGGRPLFPHILSKNCTFLCNFGQEETWCESIPEYTLVGNIDWNDRVIGLRRPDVKEACEVILMCGLPAAGKTTWANKHATEHPDKLYNILGLDNLIQKTGDIALHEEQNPSQREVFIDKSNRIFDGLMDLAYSRRRNYILDQRNNVYSSVQRRKMRNFHGYQRKAIIILPTEEEYSQRLSSYNVEKNISDSNLMGMKANFTVPLVGEFFNAVEWVGLDEEEAKKLIEKYNKEGKEAGFGQQQSAKRPRLDKSESNTRDSRNNRDSRDYRDRRNNYQDRGRNLPWRGGNMGGWRGDRPQRGGYIRHTGYGPPAPWRIRGRGGPSIRGADRRGGNIDRRVGNDRNRTVATRQSGSWGPMSNYQGTQQSGWSQQDNWSSGQSQNWSQQQSGWGQQQWGGGWKGYGQGTGYSQTGYNQQQQGYGNGNWNNWNQQYYNNQYWGQQQQSGQTTAAGSQAEIANETIATSSTDTRAEYSYSHGWQSFTQGRTTSAQSAATSTMQQSHSHK